MEEARDTDFQYRISGSLDLPNTTKRFKLFFKSDSADEDSLEEEVLPSQKEYSEERDDASVCVEFVVKKTKKLLRTIKLGYVPAGRSIHTQNSSWGVQSIWGKNGFSNPRRSSGTTRNSVEVLKAVLTLYGHLAKSYLLSLPPKPNFKT